ncbi:MOSC N-terminal beta barrel domain-containing protein [Candidatus Blastococcus massiliensis]|uniref:MOSC N-terminal beta barrel domain-containing protein n=1 Tax=Candidatus Blastococcus massiliensis TaxID=1470358 RepID=UPI0005904316|nr:MOSC N-terminal beta barrel domain-containing protein [Candidatus Blastococcus massiliensis]
MTGQRPVGRVEQIRIYPVRSLAGVAVPAAEIGSAGLVGDRAWTVVDGSGTPVRAKDVPQLATVAGEGAPDDVAAELSCLLGKAVRLEAGKDRPGAAPVHLVSRRAIDRAAFGDVPEGCTADDPRANLLLSLDGDEDERSWVGRTLHVGGALLEVTRTPTHCLGVYAEVRRAGTVTAGDAVLL